MEEEEEGEEVESGPTAKIYFIHASATRATSPRYITLRLLGRRRPQRDAILLFVPDRSKGKTV